MRLLILMCACAAPFVGVRGTEAAGVSVSSCGSTKVTAERVLSSMEPPSDLPTEVGGSGGLEPPQQAQICLKVDNRSSQTVRVDRSYLALKCPREKQPWVPDRDEQEVILHAGESKQLHVSFQYSPMTTGEDVSLLLDRAFTIGGRALKLPALPLRKN